MIPLGDCLAKTSTSRCLIDWIAASRFPGSDSGRAGNRLRKANGHAQAAAVDPGPELDAGAVVFGDLLDDRQTETAATIEAVEHSLAVLDRNARPAVAHGEHDAACIGGERDIDSAAAGGVTNR